MSSAAPRAAAVTYHRRLATDEDPALAREELRRAVADRGLELLAEIEEAGLPTRDRPGLRRLLELAQQYRVSHVVIWELAGFGCSQAEALETVRELKGAGVTLIAHVEGLEFRPDVQPSEGRGRGVVGP